MEAAFTRFRTVIAIAATIVIGAAMTQTIAPARGRAGTDAGQRLPADVLGGVVGGAATRRAPDVALGNEVREAQSAVRAQAATRPCDRAEQVPRRRAGQPACGAPRARTPRPGRAAPPPAGPGRRTCRQARRPLARERGPYAGGRWLPGRDPRRAATRFRSRDRRRHTRRAPPRRARLRLLDPPVRWQPRQVVRGSTPAKSVVRALDRRTRTPAGRSPRRAASLPPALRPTREIRPPTS